MSLSIPPHPSRSPIADKNGMATAAWTMWFRDVFQRIGGLNAPTNLELATSGSLDVSGLQAQITALTSRVDDLSNDGTVLNQDPVA